jgi:AcrR family transcriptional regulator
VSRRDEIVAAARDLLEEEGPEALTMRRLAERLGIQAPSLYKHLPGKGSLEGALAGLAVEELAEALVPARDLRELARAYRRHAAAHPHLYRLATAHPAAGLEERVAARLAALAGGRDRALALGAFAHGMVELELAGRLPPEADLDAAWEEGVSAFARAAPPPPRAVVSSIRGPD